MSELSALRAQYKELSGKYASPAMKADALKAKIAELQAAAAAAAAAQDPPADEPPVVDAQDDSAAPVDGTEPAADAPADAPADEPAAEAAEPEQSVEEACAELGIEPDGDGQVTVDLLVSMAGAECKAPGDQHSCAADEAVRLVRAGFAKHRG